MRLKVPFFGYVLALVGFLLPSVIFIALLPSLINAEPVKRRLISELRSWTGSEIVIHGPVSVESFFSLSMNVQNVEFKGFAGVPELKSLRAGALVGRISWTNLLLGKLDFDKIGINDATAVLAPMTQERIGGTVLAMLTGPYRTPFTDFTVANCKFASENGEPQDLSIDTATLRLRRSDRRVDFAGAVNWRGEAVSLNIRSYAHLPHENVDAVPIRVRVRSRLFNGQINGAANLAAGAPWTASGDFNVNTPNMAELARWTGAAVTPSLTEAMSLAGTVDFGRDHFNLQSANFILADERVDGDLNIGFDAAGPRIDGSLAFDSVDLHRLWMLAVGSDGGNSSQAARLIGRASIDLRVSANEMRWRSLAVQRSAFTISGRAGHLMAEIADLRLFNGSLLGHVSADLDGDRTQIRAKLTAEDIDTSQLLMMANQDWLTGQADVNMELEAAGRNTDELLGNAKANARLSLPDGGQVRLNLLQLAQQAPPADQSGWNRLGLDWSAFDELRLELAFTRQRLRCKGLKLMSSATSLSGSGEVDLGKQTVDWKLQIGPGTSDTGDTTGAKSTDSNRAGPNLLIEGPWAAPAIRFGKPVGGKSRRDGAAMGPVIGSRNL